MTEAEACARIRAVGGAELLERLVHLEQTRTAPRPLPPALRPADRGATSDFDVAIAGGGLSLCLAPVLAARGLTVVVLERARSGAVHREWNASAVDLAAARAAGLLAPEVLAATVVARYESGVCRFHRGGTHRIRGALDHAIDAAKFLGGVRAAAEARGVTLLDRHELLGHAAGPTAVALAVRTTGSAVTRPLSARVLVDARGAASPLARADLVCPTVGGVVTGLLVGQASDEIDPRVGEILATIDPMEDGRQHVWEAFPGRPGEVAVYLFHYARASAPVSLLRLYARFFAQLSRYKRGPAQLLRPTFGFIPAWSRLGPGPRAPGPRVLLVGDAAARHSPLTLCGFGAGLRSLLATATAVSAAVEGRPFALPDPAIHATTGALAALLAAPAAAGLERDDVNRLLDDAFISLAAVGPEAPGQLLRDELGARDRLRWLAGTARRSPRVVREVLAGLGWRHGFAWAARVARAAISAREPAQDLLTSWP